MADPARDPTKGTPAGNEADPIPPQTEGARAQDPSSSARATAAGGISLGGFRHVFDQRDFKLLFWGQTISALGDWVGTLAFIVAAQQLAPGRPEAVALVLVLRLLPSFFATPLGGVLSDRWDRKRMMVGSDVARFGVLMIVPFAPQLWVLYLIAFAQECFSLFFLPARDASVPNVVASKDLEAANALLMGSSFGGIPLSGPIFAFFAWLGAHFPPALPGAEMFREHPWTCALFFDALTYLVSAYAIGRMDLTRTQPQEDAPRERFVEAIREGVSYVLARPLLRGLAYAVTLGMLGGGVLFALGAGYVRETLGGGSVEFGWLMGIFGGGMVAGFVISQAKRSVTWTVRIALLSMGSVLAFMAIVPQLWIGYLAALVFGTAFSVAVIVAMSTVQARTDDAHRGRVMGVVHMLFRAALSVGALGAAGLAALVPRGGIGIAGARADENQVALLLAGGLIAAGTAGVRNRDAELDESTPDV